MAQTPPSPGKKKKPIPSWYYIAGAGALVAVYYLYSRSKANATAAAASTAAAPTGAGATTPVAAGSYGNAGDLSALAPYLSQLQGANSTTGTSGVYTPPTGELAPAGQAGYGPDLSSSSPDTTVTGADGSTYSWLPSATAAQAAQSTGQQLYYQPTTGVFSPVTWAQLQSLGGASTYLKAS